MVSKAAGCGSLWGEPETAEEHTWRPSYLSNGAVELLKVNFASKHQREELKSFTMSLFSSHHEYHEHTFMYRVGLSEE